MNQVGSYMRKRFRPRHTSTGWLEFVCPICNKKKAAYHEDYSTVKCWSCPYKFNTILFIAVIDNIPVEEVWERIFAMKVSDNFFIELGDITLNNSDFGLNNQVSEYLPYSYTPLDEDCGDFNYGMAVSYLRDKRGLDIEYLKTLSVGYCHKSPHKDSNYHINKDWYGYVVNPYISEGKIVYYTGRAYSPVVGMPHKFPEKIKGGIGKGSLLYNEDCRFGYTAMLVESLICAQTMGPLCMASGGMELSPTQKRKIKESPITNLIIAFDGDDEQKAYQQALKLAYEVISYRDINIKVIDLGYFSSRGLGKDPNEIGRDNVIKYIATQPILKQTEIYKLIIRKDAEKTSDFLF